MLRDERLAQLQEIESRGLELLERYRTLPDGAREALGRNRVDSVIEERGRRLGALAQRLKAHRDLPSEGNTERAQLEALSDGVLAGAGGRERLAERLREAERAYLEQIEQAVEASWTDEDSECLRQLAVHVEEVAESWSDAA